MVVFIQKQSQEIQETEQYLQENKLCLKKEVNNVNHKHFKNSFQTRTALQTGLIGG